MIQKIKKILPYILVAIHLTVCVWYDIRFPAYPFRDGALEVDGVLYYPAFEDSNWVILPEKMDEKIGYLADESLPFFRIYQSILPMGVYRLKGDTGQNFVQPQSFLADMSWRVFVRKEIADRMFLPPDPDKITGYELAIYAQYNMPWNTVITDRARVDALIELIRNPGQTQELNFGFAEKQIYIYTSDMPDMAYALSLFKWGDEWYLELPGQDAGVLLPDGILPDKYT